MSTPELIDAWVAAHEGELLQFLSTLVQTPSEVRPPAAGELACQQIVAAAFRRAGAEVDVFTPAEVPGLREHPAYFPTWAGMPREFTDRPNVVGRFRGSGGGRSILLSTHVDTVPREPLPWREAEPFSAAIKDGRLYGRGSWDTKWGIAVSLFAVRCLREIGCTLAGDVLVESVVDEEYGGSHGALAARLRGYNADIAINSEPTGMYVAPVHRGGGEWRISVGGDSGMNFAGAHQTNAVYKLGRLIEALRSFDSSRNSSLAPPRFYEHDPLLPTYITQIGGGGATYAEATGTPATCHVLVWVEEHAGTDQATHAERLTNFLNAYLASDEAFAGELPAYQPTSRYLPGSQIAPEHPFFAYLERAFVGAGRSYNMRGAAFACDTYVFNHHSPTPALTLGPRGGNAHAADEYVLLEDVIALVRIYARAVHEWCGPCT